MVLLRPKGSLKVNLLLLLTNLCRHTIRTSKLGQLDTILEEDASVLLSVVGEEIAV